MKKLLTIILPIVVLSACNQNTKTETTASVNSAEVKTISLQAVNADEQILFARALNAVVWGIRQLILN